MTCAQVRDAFMHQGELASDAFSEHLEDCSACRELFGQGAELAHCLTAQASGALPFPDQLFDRIEQRVVAETGVRAWLRSRPTQKRWFWLLLSALLVLLVGGVWRPRADFGQYPAERLAWLAGLSVLGIWFALRKQLTRSLGTRGFSSTPEVLLCLLLLPFVGAALPATEAAAHFGPGGALNCFTYGAVLTLPTALLLWAFDRDEYPAVRTVYLSAVALGLCANLLLELHCPNGNARHLLLGHASLGLVWLAAWFVARRTLAARLSAR